MKDLEELARGTYTKVPETVPASSGAGRRLFSKHASSNPSRLPISTQRLFLSPHDQLLLFSPIVSPEGIYSICKVQPYSKFHLDRSVRRRDKRLLNLPHLSRSVDETTHRCLPLKKFSNTLLSSRLKTRLTTTLANLTRRYVTHSPFVLRGTFIQLRHVHSHDLPIFLSFQLTKYPLLNTFEQRTQVPKSYAFLGALVLLIVLHAINAFASPVSNLLGWALPAYLSVKALESPGHNDDIQWLTYWVVFGFFNFTESFALRAVLYYFPWYFACKTLFILYLQLPAFRVSASCFVLGMA